MGKKKAQRTSGGRRTDRRAHACYAGHGVFAFRVVASVIGYTVIYCTRASDIIFETIASYRRPIIVSHYITTDTRDINTAKIRIQDCVAKKGTANEGWLSQYDVKNSTVKVVSTNSMTCLLLLTVYYLQSEVTTGWVILSSPTRYFGTPRPVVIIL